jgi:glycerol-1-phosphate dehydrogenase [NAD(P)+]
MTAGADGQANAVSVWSRQIELPRYLRKVRGPQQLVSELSSVCTQLGFTRPLLLSGTTVTLELARELAPELGAPEPVRVADNDQAQVDSIAAGGEVAAADVVVAVGGGRTIDVAKAVCENTDLPVICVPTQLTADGIASPVSVIRSGPGRIESRRARLPIGVVVDLDFVARSSPERVRAGLGDLIANRSAVRDWRLAAAAGADSVDDFAALLSESASELVYGTDVSSLAAGTPTAALLERLLDGLVLSGLAMEIAGSSRPCSGSEHLLSHAIDRLYPGTAQHGEQVAFGSLLSARLQGEDWRGLRKFLAGAGMERVASGLGLGGDRILAALEAAPATRPGRYTVLDELDLDRAALARLVEELLTPGP